MASYTIDTPDGASYTVEADTDQQAKAAISSYLPSDQGFSPEKAAKNIAPDIKGLLTGLMGTVKEGTLDMPARALSTGVQMAGGVPYAETPSGQRDTSLVENAPAQAAEIVRPITHPIRYAEEHPVQQALNVLGLGQLATKGAGMALNAVPLTENIVPTIEQIANNQTLKSMGGSMGQLKQMAKGRGGQTALNEAAQLARDKGLTDVFTTNMGRGKTLKSLLKSAGAETGALRKEAGVAPADMIQKLLDSPKAKMNEYLGEGLASGNLPKIDKALADIERIGGPNPTHAKLAEAATYINDQAAENKLYQPVTAETNIANALSDVNNQEIAQALGSEKAQKYVNLLDEQKKLHPLEFLQKHGDIREMGGRGGIGMQFVQKIADEVGYRASAKTIAAIHDSLVAENLPITKSAVAAKIATLNQPSSITDLIGKLISKYDSRRQF